MSYRDDLQALLTRWGLNFEVDTYGADTVVGVHTPCIHLTPCGGSDVFFAFDAHGRFRSMGTDE